MDLKDLMQFAPKEVRDESVLTAQNAVYAPMAKELNKKVEELTEAEKAEAWARWDKSCNTDYDLMTS